MAPISWIDLAPSSFPQPLCPTPPTAPASGFTRFTEFLEGPWRGKSFTMNALMDELVESEMFTAVALAQYLGFAKNVRAGHQDALEITGNAFSVRFTREGVRVESLWDERMAPRRIDLDEFIQVLSAWPAR